MPLVTQKWELVVFAQHELPLLWTSIFWLSSITPVEVKPWGRAAERLVISSLLRRGLALCLHGDWIASPPLERAIPAGQEAKWLRRLRAEFLTCTVYLTCGLKKNTCISWAWKASKISSSHYTLDQISTRGKRIRTKLKWFFANTLHLILWLSKHWVFVSETWR